MVSVRRSGLVERQVTGADTAYGEGITFHVAKRGHALCAADPVRAFRCARRRSVLSQPVWNETSYLTAARSLSRLPQIAWLSREKEGSMLSWLGKKMIAATWRRPGRRHRTDPEDGRRGRAVQIPGQQLPGGRVGREGRAEPWLRRFADVGLQIYPDEAILKGFPWRQTICVRGYDHLDSPEGERVYENRYVIWGQSLGPAARVRGLRGHPENQGARRVPRPIGKL